MEQHCSLLSDDYKRLAGLDSEYLGIILGPWRWQVISHIIAVISHGKPVLHLIETHFRGVIGDIYLNFTICHQQQGTWLKLE